MDAATATLIGQLVATDMARQDHKDKATAHSSVIVKQRPPPPHRSLSQHLQRTSVVAAATTSTSTVTHTTASPKRSSTESDRKPAAESPRRVSSAAPSDHDRMLHDKRRSRAPAVMTPRPKYQAAKEENAPLPGLERRTVPRTPSRHSTTPSEVAAAPIVSQDDALQQAKQQERERGPQLMSVRRTPSRHSATPSTPLPGPAAPGTPAPPTIPRTFSEDAALQHAKRQERERGPQWMTVRRSRWDAPQPRSTADDEKQPYRGAASHDDDDASTDSAYALAMARSHLQQGPLRSAESAGPSLATATGAVEVHPGAVAFLGTELHRKSGAVTAGVPVPGAFAVQGLGASHQDDDSVDTEEEEDEEDLRDPTELYGDLENPRATATTTTPLEAEVYEQVVVDGALADADEEILDPKTVRRLRTVQVTILGLALFAVGIIIGSILGFTARGSSGDGGPPPVLGWQPVGSTLFGANTDTPQTLFGSALALSANGQRLAVAAPGTDNGTALNVGTVYVLEAYQNENGTDWRTLETLAGPGPSPEAHTALALAAESTLAVGYSRYTQGRPVQVWQSPASDESPWTTPASVPVGNASEDAWWGYAVDLSADGTILAVGAPRMNGPYGVSSGVVQIFQWQPSTGGNVSWVPMGASLYGTSVDEFFGWTLSLSSGPRLAVGAPVYNDTSGVVRLYDWNAGSQEWMPGADLRGDVPLGRFGESVALSGKDGTVLAVGARGSAFDEGSVKVYRERNGQWVRDEEPMLQGQVTGEGFGAAVALSWDGGTLAVGAPQSNHFGQDTGAVSVYRYLADRASWKQHGSAMGSALVSEFGASVSLSDDGLRVAGGAPMTAYDGSVARAGCVLVYDLVELSS
jgi:hypothetical protein